MSQGKRYKFQGSRFSVQIGFAATVPVEAVTKANPAVLTSTAHGQLDGAVGKIAAVLGMIELNGGLFVVDNKTTDSFELAGVDSTDYTAYASGGTFAPVVFSPFCEVTNINQQDGTSGEIDATTICSTAKEFEVGLSDSGSLTLDYNYAGAEAVQAALRAAKRSGETVAFQLVLPGAGGTLTMLGSVQQQSITGGVDGIYTGSATIKLTGEIFVQ